MIPSTSSISDDPVFPDADREPCFITGMPAAEARMEAMLETFTVPTKSPPVPTISNASFPVSNKTACLSMTSTRPASSETVSPLERSANINAAISASLESPAMICDIAQFASERSRSDFAISFAKMLGQLGCGFMCLSLVFETCAN